MTAVITDANRESTKLASPFNGMNRYVSCTPLEGTELGPVWEVVMASVANDLWSAVVVRLIEGIRTLKEVEPVSTVT